MTSVDPVLSLYVGEASAGSTGGNANGENKDDVPPTLKLLARSEIARYVGVVPLARCQGHAASYVSVCLT